MYTLVTHVAYFAVVILLATSAPRESLGSLQDAQASIFIIGFLGLWRYSWAFFNFIRANIFRRIVFPIRKRRYVKAYEERGYDAHAYFMVTSYTVEPEVTVPVYRALFKAAANSKGGATIIASVVDGADERLIREIYNRSKEDLSRVVFIIDRIPSNGKRDAIAKALKIIRDFMPTERDICVFLDGDTIPPEDLVAQAAPVFSQPMVGALTTDEGVLIERKNLFRDWFVLRFNQRQVMFCSQGLSKRVLTLTGRMSVFRANLAVLPEFIDQIGDDFLDHWRLGRVKFLTGDDKSTWYWLLRNGYEMHYLPDVRSFSMETQPRPTFFESARTLMVRWFGNMLRTNGRALRLSPNLIGYFTWYAILDQRLSMWTTLVGPITIALTAILVEPQIIPLYISWVLLTRYVFCVIISVFRGGWFPITHPPLLYFSQVFGAMVKTFVFFRLDKQRWTRQAAIQEAQEGGIEARIKKYESTAHHAVALAFLTIAIMFLTQL